MAEADGRTCHGSSGSTGSGGRAVGCAQRRGHGTDQQSAQPQDLDTIGCLKLTGRAGGAAVALLASAVSTASCSGKTREDRIFPGIVFAGPSRREALAPPSVTGPSKLHRSHARGGVISIVKA